MNESKRTEVITFRTTKEMKKSLEEIAKLNQWSIAQAVFAIIHNYLIDEKPNSIIIKADDFYKYVNETESTLKSKALEISIYYYENDEDCTTEKYLCIDGVECGGLGSIANINSVKEMDQEAIQELP